MKRFYTPALAALFILSALMSCSRNPEPVLKVVDTENNKLIVLAGERTKPVNFYDADFVILGGGLGGIAAALSICSSGRTALLVEETDRIAGCFSYQDTSLFSENRFVETSGTSKTYQTFRDKIRAWYKKNSLSPPQLYSDIFSEIEDFGVDDFCFETEAALEVIDEMLESNIARGKLTVIKRHKIAKIVTFSDRIASLHAIDLDGLVCNQITGWMFIDATRSGYVLPLVDIDHVRIAESAADTGEPHAPDVPDSLLTGEYIYCPYTPLTKDGGEFQDCYVAEFQTGKPRNSEGMVVYPARPQALRLQVAGRIREQDIAAENNSGPRATFFKDSVGIGYHPIVLASREGKPEITIPTKPFQIPLGAIIPGKISNYLSGGRTIGATYLASRAYRAPSVEWAIGEAAGEAAAYCAGYKIYADELLEYPEHVRGLQDWLVTKRGVPIYWYDDVTPQDPDFAEAQLKPFDESGFHASRTNLHYRN